MDKGASPLQILWNQTYEYQSSDESLAVKMMSLGFGRALITLEEDVSMVVLRHRRQQNNAFLGFYIVNQDGLSSKAHGLIGK